MLTIFTQPAFDKLLDSEQIEAIFFLAINWKKMTLRERQEMSIEAEKDDRTGDL